MRGSRRLHTPATTLLVLAATTTGASLMPPGDGGGAADNRSRAADIMAEERSSWGCTGVKNDDEVGRPTGGAFFHRFVEAWC